MRVEVGCQASPIGKAVEMFNKYAAVVTTVIAAVTGLTLKLNQLREKRNEREDAKADVEALTGLSKDSIDWLEQQAVRLSTQMTESASGNQQQKSLTLTSSSVLPNRSYYRTRKH